MRMRLAFIAVGSMMFVGACDSKSSPAIPAKEEPAQRATAKQSAKVVLGDLTKSLESVRDAFNAKKGEARFLTLLAPT